MFRLFIATDAGESSAEWKEFVNNLDADVKLLENPFKEEADGKELEAISSLATYFIGPAFSNFSNNILDERKCFLQKDPASFSFF